MQAACRLLDDLKYDGTWVVNRDADDSTMFVQWSIPVLQQQNLVAVAYLVLLRHLVLFFTATCTSCTTSLPHACAMLPCKVTQQVR